PAAHRTHERALDVQRVSADGFGQDVLGQDVALLLQIRILPLGVVVAGDVAGSRKRLLRVADRPLDEVGLKAYADLAQVRAERRIVTGRDETVVALDVDVLHTGARQLLGFTLA